MGQLATQQQQAGWVVLRVEKRQLCLLVLLRLFLCGHEEAEVGHGVAAGSQSRQMAARAYLRHRKVVLGILLTAEWLQCTQWVARAVFPRLGAGEQQQGETDSGQWQTRAVWQFGSLAVCAVLCTEYLRKGPLQWLRLFTNHAVASS